VALVFTIAGVTMAAQFPGGEEPSPRVIGLVPEWRGFVETDEWNFGSILVTASPKALEATFIGAQIADQFVTSSVKKEWREVVPVGPETETALQRFEELHRLQVLRQAGQAGKWTQEFEEKIEREYYTIRQQISARLAQLRERGEHIDRILARIPSVAIRPGETIVLELIFEVRKRNHPTQIHRLSVPTSVTKLFPLEVEDHSVWLPADLHLHSEYSECADECPITTNCLRRIRDIDPDMVAMGYRIVYMADHVGTVATNLQREFCICNHPVHGCTCCDCGLTSPTTWECYFRNTQLVSTPQIAFFPGVEIDTRIHEGHALIYGLNNLNRADGGGEFFCNDLTGPELVGVIPAGSSLAIAHPEPWWPGWWEHNWDWGTTGYRGVEVMGPGPETHFSWWRDRAFTPQALADAVAGHGVLSVRTGSDFHGPNTWVNIHVQIYTFVHVPVSLPTWDNLSWSVRRSLVNTALREGRTIASEHGGFARLTVNGRLPGTVMRNVPKNTSLSLNIRFRPVLDGVYRLAIYRNRDELVWSHQDFFTAGTLWTTTITTTFPGGTQGYWLRVDDIDSMRDICQITSTPVIVTSQP